MPKLKSRSHARMATAAGLTTGAVTAALVVYPMAAFAVATVTPPVAPPLSNVTITEDGATFTSGSGVLGSRVQLLTTAGATCAATIGTVGATILTATVTTATTTAVEFTLPAGATAGTNGQVKRYTACVYDTVGGTTNRQGLAAGYPVLVGNAPTINPALGTTGGGNILTVTAADGFPIFTSVTTVGAAFSTSVCAATYGTPTAGTTTTVTRDSNTAATLTVPTGVTSTTASPTQYNLCLYNGTGTTSALISSVRYSTSQLALSQATGPYQGANGLNITSPNQFLAGIDTPGVVFSTAACPTYYTQTEAVYSVGVTPSTKFVPSANVRKLTNTRMAVTVPALLAAPPSTALAFNVCVYGGQEIGASTLVASTTYTATTVQVATGITPKAGPALGKSRIIVTGTAFPTEPGLMTATLGGSALTEITPISSTAFEATTPQHAPANNVALVVSTAAGQHILPNAYSFTSALVVTPNTAPNTRAVDLIVNGVGFQSASWSNTVTTGSHIFLVEGTYNSSETAAGDRANPPVADCSNVLVLSDNELICNLNLTRRLDLEGEAVLIAPVTTALTGLGTTVGSRVITGAAATFSEESVGLTLSQSGTAALPAGTTIVAVLDDETALISTNATATDPAVAAAATPPVARTIAALTTTASSAALTGTGFTSADIGRYVITADVSSGQTIATTPTSTTATLSGTATAGAVGAAATLLTPYLPVPEGAYNLTYVSNAAMNAVGSDSGYVQSQVSSQSTFTVSAF